MIVSSTTGRLRVRHPTFRSSSRVQRARDVLLALPGVRSAAGDERVGSLLVAYDPAQTSEAAIVSALDLGSMSERAATPRAMSRVPAATVGMGASLAVSLGAAAAKIKWLHVTAGVVFVALVGVHVFGRTQRRPKHKHHEHRGRQHDV